MKRKWLVIGISTISVIILLLTSFTNVVGYQTVQNSQQTVIKERINPRELLFQTICDIANNKEIQRIIMKSQMMNGKFLSSDVAPITKQQLRQMYLIGLIVLKFSSKSRMQSMIQKNQLINPEIQKELSTVIDKDAILKKEITQLKDSECDCDNENTTTWRFPVICTMLYFLYNFLVFLVDRFHQLYYSVFLVSCIWMIMGLASYSLFNCGWYY